MTDRHQQARERADKWILPPSEYPINEELMAMDVLWLLDENQRMRDELDILHDRGDHLIYRHEWEAFNEWQRTRVAADSTVETPADNTREAA